MICNVKLTPGGKIGRVKARRDERIPAAERRTRRIEISMMQFTIAATPVHTVKSNVYGMQIWYRYRCTHHCRGCSRWLWQVAKGIYRMTSDLHHTGTSNTVLESKGEEIVFARNDTSQRENTTYFSTYPVSTLRVIYDQIHEIIRTDRENSYGNNALFSFCVRLGAGTLLQ